MQNIKVFLPIC